MLILYRKPDFDKDVECIINEFLKKEECENGVQWVHCFCEKNNCSLDYATKQYSLYLDMYVRLRELGFDEYINNLIEKINDTQCVSVHKEFEFVLSFKNDIKMFFQEIRAILFDEDCNVLYVSGIHNKKEEIKIYKTFTNEIENKIKILIEYGNMNKKTKSINEEKCSEIWNSNEFNDSILKRLNIHIKYE